MPNWLVQFLIQEVLKLLTPEVLDKLSQAAKQFAVCELQRLVKSTPSQIDDTVLAAVAQVLGVDLSKCSA